MKKKIGLIFNGTWSHYAFAKAPKYRDIYQLIYIHDLTFDKIKDFEAVVIPFQSNHEALTRKKQIIYDFLAGRHSATGKKVFLAGDSTTEWLEGRWEDRPVNNWWWVTHPDQPPVTQTNYEHPVYQGLKPRHACWHTHGVYTEVPSHAEVIQTNSEGEIITWQTHHYGGTLLVTTLDPIVEHGIQQITHLDNYCDSLTAWLCGIRPTGKFEILKEDYGIDAFVETEGLRD